MKLLVFFTGGNMTDAQAKSLGDYLQGYLVGHIPKDITVWVRRYNDKTVAGAILQQGQPGFRLALAGHSFGGKAAIDVATTLALVGRKVDGLILIDPVDEANNKGPNPGFALTQNVAKSWAFYREAKAVPWSAGIKSAAGEFSNTKYNPVTTDPHGEYVWRPETLAAITTALK